MTRLLAALFCTALPAAALPIYDHIVVVVEENHGYSQIIGNPAAPFINSLASSGALMTNSFGITHPSQPNYLHLFSGSDQGVTDNSTPHTFNTANLGSVLAAAGRTFAGYSESLPSSSFTGDNAGGADGYWRKHNPWINFSNLDPNSTNLPFTDFPADFTQLPNVAFVIPNQGNDMHNGTIAIGDAWLQANLGAYILWAQTHNSLFILTFDEDNSAENNHIVTLFAGANVKTGLYAQTVNHYDLLRTIEDLNGTAYAGASANANTIADVFTPEPSSWTMIGLSAMALILRSRLTR